MQLKQRKDMEPLYPVYPGAQPQPPKKKIPLPVVILGLIALVEVALECNDNMRIIALFEKTDEEIENFEKDLNSQSAYVSFERI